MRSGIYDRIMVRRTIEQSQTLVPAALAALLTIVIWVIMDFTTAYGFTYTLTENSAMNPNIDIDAILAAIAWPVLATIVLVLVIVHHERLGPFIKELRISKVSAGPVSLEFAQTIVHEAKEQLQLKNEADIIDLRSDGTAEPLLNEANDTLVKQIKQAPSTGFAIFDLDIGKTWLSSRLYLFTIILQNIHKLKRIVFICNRDGIKNSFVGITEPQQLRSALAKEYPWLEDAFPQAYIDTWRQIQRRHIFGSIDQITAMGIVPKFLGNIQRDHPPLGTSEASEWTKMKHKGTWEHAEWITIDRLEEILGQALDTSSWISESEVRNKGKGDLIRRVIYRAGDYVAILDKDRSFEKQTIIDKNELARDAALDVT
jgi:hypothetical protein